MEEKKETSRTSVQMQWEIVFLHILNLQAKEKRYINLSTLHLICWLRLENTAPSIKTTSLTEYKHKERKKETERERKREREIEREKEGTLSYYVSFTMR